MNTLPTCPLCLGALVYYSKNTNNDLLFDTFGPIGESMGTHAVDATCENGCHIFVQASKQGNPASDGAVPVRFRALSSGALKAGW